MLRPDVAKWDQSVEDLQRLAIRAQHARTRERFYALHRMASAELPATAVANELGRDPRCVMRWVNSYNHAGPGTLEYQRTGGRPPLFVQRERRSSLPLSRTRSRRLTACLGTSGRSAR
jgi:transposase